MSFERVKPSNYPVGGTVASTELNQLDIDHANALDKTAAGDTLSGLITVAAGGGFIFQSTATSHFESGAGPLFDNGSFIGFQSGAAVALTVGISGATLTAASGIAWVLLGPVTVGGAAIFNGSVSLAGTTKIQLGSRSIERVSTNMMRNENATTSAQWQLSVPSADTCDQELDIPDGATLTDVRVGVVPGHAPPAGTKVTLQIIRRDLLGNLTALGGTATDPNTAGAYAAGHTFLFSAGGGGSLGGGAVVDRTQYRYFATLNGETGSGAGAVLMIGCSAIFAPASYDDGAA